MPNRLDTPDLWDAAGDELASDEDGEAMEQDSISADERDGSEADG